MTLRLLIAQFALLGTLSGAHAQLFGAEKDGSGGGTWHGCDSASLTVAFTDQSLGELAYRFDPQIDTSGVLVSGNLWSYYDGGNFEQVFIDTLTRTFYTPGDHLVCLTVNAYDLTVMQPCSTTTCRIIDILQDPSCDALDVDFSIAAVDGQTVSFQDLTIFDEGIAQWYWSFDDGSIATTSSPQHTFEGPGPHRVCLTVVGPPPVQCWAMRCQYLYMGPAPVPCELLFTPGFLLFQYQNMVGVMDSSVTSGMNSMVSWSFGDGTTATGRYAIHAYGQDGTYELCSTVDYWGPLLADTCSTTECTPVVVMEALGLEEIGGAGAETRAWPVPFTETIYLSYPAGASGTIVVFDDSGRRVHEQRHDGSGLVHLDLGQLIAGAYLVQCTSPQAVHVARLLKE